MSGVKQLLPEENALILNNGRRIGYKQLVLATGIKHDFTQIKGFYDALEDPEHPVYASKDPDSWRAGVHKYAKYITNYKQGNGFFCIPPYPYAGEVECFNFFVSNEVWSWA
jgi:NADPH-dependent 2,4-dienoyl-CoA reductase/sulfur reductase-like enzyme